MMNREVPSSLSRFRPAFMERDMVSPSWGVLDERYREMKMRRSSSSSSSSSRFPIKYDAGYIGYLSDDESGDGGGDGGDEYDIASVVRRRRLELLGYHNDITFSGCLFLVVTVALLIAILVAMMMIVK